MKRIFITILFVGLWCSCTNGLDYEGQESNLQSEESVQQETDASFVSESLALSVAGNFQDGPQARSAEEADIQTVFDENSQPLMYIINYPEGGFVIVGATKNYYPILGYSDKGHFTTDGMEECGLSEWFSETKYAIKNCGGFDEDVMSQMQYLWNFYSDREEEEMPESRASDTVLMRQRMVQLMELYPGFVCRPLSECRANDFPLYGREIYAKLCQLATQYGSPLEYTICGIKNNNSNNIVGPLLETEWHQHSPYNDPYGGNVIGCATVAVAQIMKFHQFPAQYNWSNIPIGYNNVSSETHRLIADILPVLGIDPYKDAGANIDDARKAFQAFQYTVQKKNHNNTDVKNELLINRRPVYMRGRDANDLGNHAWVCDGINAYTHGALYFIECKIGDGYQDVGEYTPQYPGEIVYTGAQYHMNWGVEREKYTGKSFNGWFQTNDVAVGSYDFCKERMNLYVSPIR